MPKTSSHPASATAAPSANGVEVQRLPVNPRRKKVAPDERKRVATACNSCNIRRIKCSGEKPCHQCAGASRPCLYPPPTQKVTVTKAWVEDMKRRNAELELGLRLFGQGEDLFKHLRISMPYGYQSDGESEGEEQVDSEGDIPIPDIEGKMLLDASGTSRFHGETSGATFLDTLKGFIRTSASLPDGNGILFLQSEGQYQTSDSLPLQLPPDDQVDVSWLPPPPEAKRLLAIVRNAIMDGNGAYPCGGIFFWPLMDLDKILAELSPQGPAVQPVPEQSYRPLAVYHAAFAFATILEQTGADSRREGQNGEAYFARARKVLGNPFDIHLYSIHDVPALTLMALYYIENNRRDAASTYISTAMNLCRMHGVDRGSSDDLAEHRVFWTLYILDRWLSCLMGRLPMIPDDAIKLPMPQACRGLPLPVGLQAHVELSYISNFIVHNSTRDRGCKNRNGFPRGVGIAQTMLSKWMETLPDSLKIKSSAADPDRPFHVDTGEIAHKLSLDGQGIDRALLSLHMSYNQLVILTVRPAFLAAVRRAVATGFLDETTIWSPDDDKIIKSQGLRNYADVARVNIDLARQLWNDGERKLLVQDLHHVFNAAIILLMYQMLFMNQRTSDTLAIDLAISIFRKEQEAGSGFGTDCLHVLEDLKMLVGKLRPTIFRYDDKEVSSQKREFDFNVPLRLRQSSSPPLQPDLKNKLESWKSEKSSLYNSGGCMVDNK